MTQKNASTAARTFGYCRVSTKHQSIRRQETEIKGLYPDAVIFSEQWTGTEMDRPEWMKLYKRLRPGDTVIFTELSRLARTAQQGFEVYEDLFTHGVNMVFLHDSNANSDVYRNAMNQQRIDANITTGSDATDTLIKTVLDALQRFTFDIVREQIRHSFNAAESEVTHLHDRVKKGMADKGAGAKIAASRQGRTFETKKEREAKVTIRKHSKDFGGSLNDADCMKLIGISRGSFYKYKKALWNDVHSAPDTAE